MICVRIASSLNTDLSDSYSNFEWIDVESYGYNWAEANEAIRPKIGFHKITGHPRLTGSIIHNSKSAPIWNEIALTFQPCVINEYIGNVMPIIVYGTGGRVYTGMVLSYNPDTSEYSIICFPENVALQNMVIQGEVISINSF